LERTIKKENNMENNVKMSNSIDAIIDAMNDGDRITMKDLVARVATETEITYAVVMQFAPKHVRSSDKVEIAKGRNGGVYKGKKPVKK
jgi:hypothetical protein